MRGLTLEKPKRVFYTLLQALFLNKKETQMFRNSRYAFFAAFTFLFLFVGSFATANETVSDFSSFSKIQVPENFPIQADGRIFACVQLTEKATAEVYIESLKASGGKSLNTVEIDRAKSLARSHFRTVTEQQKNFLETLKTKSKNNIAVIYSVQRLFNGIVIRTDSDSLSKIASLPQVKAIWPVFLKKHENTHSIPLLGAPEVWSEIGLDVTGRGVKVGVIDTGIDYVHTDFGGSGLAADYEANDPVSLDDITFPTTRVVGGYDFAGEEYNPEDSSHDVPVPDPDPMDYGSHGTHVAGTIGGGGVNADGTAYLGPYNQSLDLSTFIVGPGVAPQCDLYALKVFGTGSSALAGQAIEWAVDPNGDSDFSDRLDVVNLSLGGNYGNESDFESQIYANAVDLGLIVVAAAGNSGDLNFISGNPAAHPDVISVAASWHDGTAFLAMAVNSPESMEGNYQAEAAGFGPALTEEGITGTLVKVSPALACSTLSNAEDLAGKIALIDRGECYFVDKVKRAQEAGAIAAVVINNVEGWAFQMGGNATNVEIPSVMISNADGALIKAALAEGVEVTLSSSNRIFRPELADSIGSFSSRGPSYTGQILRLKPDITAPGVNIVSALTQSGSEAFSASGTSMACPHMTGVMALLRDLHPDWSVSELKALVMNTAGHDVKVFDSDPAVWHGPARVGAGRVDVAAASKSDVIAYNHDNPSWVSITSSLVDITEPTDETLSVRLKNLNTDDLSYEMSLDIKVDMPGVEYILPEDKTVEVNGLSTSDLNIILRSNPAEMKLVHDPTIEETSNGESRQWISEESGYLVLTPVDKERGETLRVPLYAMKRPASNMQSGETIISTMKDIDTVTLAMTGAGVDTGDDLPFDQKSLVTPFELKYEKLIAESDLHGLPDWYDESLLDFGIFKHAGVYSDYASISDEGQSVEDSRLYFAVSMHAPWGTPSSVLFYLLIDNNNDGEPEIIAFNGVWETDVYVIYFYDMQQNEVVGAAYVNSYSAGLYSIPVFMADSMVFPIPGEILGLNDAVSQISFRIQSFLSGYMLNIDDTGWMEYDVKRPAMIFNRGKAGMPSVYDMPENEIEVEYDLQAGREFGTFGLMLLHHHNANGERSEKVRFSGLGCEEDTDCPEDLPYCDDNMQRCVQCITSVDCNDGEICVNKFCMPIETTDGDAEDDSDGDYETMNDGDIEDLPDVDGDIDNGSSDGTWAATQDENLVIVNSGCNGAGRGDSALSLLGLTIIAALLWVARKRSRI